MPRPDSDRFQLAAGQVLMLSDYSRLSFDGRYFGPIPRSQLGEVVRPVLVWGKAGD
jgi:type IV secretory pathway protease TraF